MVRIGTFIRIGETICDWQLMSAIAGTRPQRSSVIPAVFAALFLVAVFSCFLFTLMLMVPSFATIRLIYDFHTFLLPIVLGCAAVGGIAYWNRYPYERGVLRLSVLFLAATIGLLTVRVYATHVEPQRLQVKRVTIQTSKTKHPFRIMHISDIQSAGIGKYEQNVFEEIRKLAPDLVIFTGDLLQPLPPATMSEEVPKMAALLDSISPSNGIIGVLGDVDEYFASNRDAIPGIVWLEDAKATIRTDAISIEVLGLSRERARSGISSSTISQWLSETKQADFTIAVSHAPDFILDAMDMHIDLCLAGHTHGGQIRLPLVGPLVTMSKAPRALCRGFNEVGKTRLNVSAGIGCEHTGAVPAIRINCPPEMTLIELVPEPKPLSTLVAKESL